jgi:methylated-DNA-[protein]-cysteine S-methyltransferase
MATWPPTWAGPAWPAVGQALGPTRLRPSCPATGCWPQGGARRVFRQAGALTKLRMLELEGAAWGGTRSLFE